MEPNYPRFTQEMKKTHTILIPNMLPLHFSMLAAALEYEGYHVEVLGNCGSQVAQLGLKYVHNDTCYPALLVIGQFLDALQSGKYDLDHTALLITQTGGGCRASNYIHLLRKALQRAGYGHIPVASLNFSGLEKDSGFQMNLSIGRKAIAAIFYGDLIMALRNQTSPYEVTKGQAKALAEKWVDTICGWFHQNKGFSGGEMKATFPRIAKDFAAIPVVRTPKVKVGIVGEIYVKYSPLGNNNLEEFLASQDCEVNLPGLLGFVDYCISNMGDTVRFYGGSLAEVWGSEALLKYLDGFERAMGKAMREAGFGHQRLREHRLRPALRLPAQPHLRQGHDQPHPGHLSQCQHHPHRLRPQCHSGKPGEPHQADDQRGQGAAGRERRRPARPGAGAGIRPGIQD